MILNNPNMSWRTPDDYLRCEGNIRGKALSRLCIFALCSKPFPSRIQAHPSLTQVSNLLKHARSHCYIMQYIKILVMLALALTGSAHEDGMCNNGNTINGKAYCVRNMFDFDIHTMTDTLTRTLSQIVRVVAVASV